MKKVVLSLAVLFTVALVSCSGNKEAAADSDSMMATDSMEQVESAEATVDSPVVDSPVAVEDSAK